MYEQSDPTLDMNRLRNVEMFKMSQFEPISIKKLRVFPETRFLKHRYIFLRLKTAFSRHFVSFAHSIYWKVSK
jgi:hypothetical protein